MRLRLAPLRALSLLLATLPLVSCPSPGIATTAAPLGLETTLAPTAMSSPMPTTPPFTATPTATLAPRPSPTLTFVPAPSSTPAPAALDTSPPQSLLPLVLIPEALLDSTPGAALLSLINALRHDSGCAALRAEPRLAESAQRHAEDLAATQRIDHRGSDGATLRERMARAGYPATLYGENIAASYATPQEVLDAWALGDEIPNGPHRLNLLNCAYQEAGVGLANDDTGAPYWVLDLGSQ